MDPLGLIVHLLRDPVLVALAVLALGGVVLVLLGWREAQTLRLTRFLVHGPAVPLHLDGLRLVHLTDLHLPAYRALRRRVQEAVRELRPDLTCLSGDIVSHPRHMALAREFLQALGETAPLCGVPGNGEYWRNIPQVELRGLFAATGGVWLENQSAALQVRGATIALVGVADPELEHADFDAAFREAPPGDLRLLLVHSPVVWPEIAERAGEFDLALAGHVHAGQWRVPGLPTLLKHSLVPRYLASGLFRVRRDGSPEEVLGHWEVLRRSEEPIAVDASGDPLLYVSRGVGAAGIPLRLGAPPEIVLFEFRRADAG